MDFIQFYNQYNITDDNQSTDYHQYYNEDEEKYLPLIFIFYATVIFFGVLGNASLFVTIYFQPSGRLRNPLLVALCLADLLVSGVSAPLTVFKISLIREPIFISELGCKAIYLLQSIPVAASTFSLLMLSFDRYATVKHPRLAQLRQRRVLPIMLASGAWISASLLHIPMLVVYKTILFDTLTNKTSCKLSYRSIKLHFFATIFYTLIIFVLPALGVILNYLSVKKKLCALSLTARAAHGELPLPMPILRRPTHMIIVTGITNGARGVVGGSSDDDGLGLEMKTRTRTPRSAKHSLQNYPHRHQNRTPLRSTSSHLNSSRQHQQSQSNNRDKRPAAIKVPAPDLPLGQTSTLRSRRKLAYMLVTAALIFAGCWTPHIICLLTNELGAPNFCTKSFSDFSLLLGYAHSAFSPLINWALNRNSLTISSCIPLACLRSGRKFIRSHLKVPSVPPPSSTNEAQLGPFNPRYIKTRPQVYADKASSHLY